MADSFYKYFVNMQFMDSGGNKTRRRVEVNGGLDGVDLATNVNTIVTKMRALTDCNLTQYGIESVWINDDLTYPSGDVNVEEQETVTMHLNSGPKAASFDIPGPKAANFVGTSGPNKNIGKDTTYTPMSDLIGLFNSGGPAFISDGENTLPAPDGFQKARRTHKGSTRG